jgi:MFS family permease
MEGLERAVLRNTVILSAATALNWAVIVLVAALTALTIGTLFGLPGLAGAGFAAYLLAFAAGGLLFGRAMDAFGRRNALAVGFLIGALGALVIHQGVGAGSIPLSLAGLLIVGMG